MSFVTCYTDDCSHNKCGICDLSDINVDEGCDFARDDTKILHEKELVKLRLWNIAMSRKKEVEP